MPAIDLLRLHTRLGLSLAQIDDPPRFLHELRETYDFYADQTHPVGVFTRSAFNTPALLNREIVSTLSKYCVDRPDLILQLIDLLWQEPEVEFRRLAAQLLGKLPADKSKTILERIRIWSQNVADTELLPFLHQQASVSIRQNNPQLWMDLLNEWKSSRELWQTSLAIQGIIPLIDDREFENLPAIFSFLTPLIIHPSTVDQFEMLSVIEHLAQRSEVETVYFLKQMVSLSTDPEMDRFMRRVLDVLSPSMQESLQKTFRERKSLK